MIIDAWMQHPTVRLAQHEMLAPLRRWTGMEALSEELPIAMTIAAMDAAGVGRGLLSAWVAPEAPMAETLPARVLLVEDNPINQKVALRILDRLGYRADVASDGVAAVAVVQKIEYDVVLAAGAGTGVDERCVATLDALSGTEQALAMICQHPTAEVAHSA